MTCTCTMHIWWMPGMHIFFYFLLWVPVRCPPPFTKKKKVHVKSKKCKLCVRKGFQKRLKFKSFKKTEIKFEVRLFISVCNS